MRVGLEIFERGIAVAAGGREQAILYPEEVWRGFEPKREFAAELVLAATWGAPVAAGEREVLYDFPRPRNLERYRGWFRLTLPWTLDTHPDAPGVLDPEALERIERRFSGDPPRGGAHAWSFPETSGGRAVVALTLGKDSLASLLLGQEMGLDLAGVYCHHPSLPAQHAVRAPRLAALGAHLAIPVHVVSDSVRDLVQGLAAGSHPTGTLWPLAVAIYALMLLPFARHHRAGLLALGNEHDANYPTRLARGGGLAEMSPLQSWAGTAMLDDWIAGLTSGAVRVTSWIHALHALACHKLVHAVRPDVGAYQVSCRRLPPCVGGEQPPPTSPPRPDARWCQECRTCAENYLYATAMGRDPASLGFDRCLLDETSAAHFHLLSGGLDREDPHRWHAARQERLACHLAGRAVEETWLARRVLEGHGPLAPPELDRLRREYLEPRDGDSRLPMAARAAAAARRLLASPSG